MDYPTDCLVLRIVEHIKGSGSGQDTTLFVLFDKRKNQYVIRGKRVDTVKSVAIPYSFISDSVKDLAYFIRFLICKKNRLTYEVYNYDNLPADSNDITFDFLESNVDIDYELTAYDNCKVNYKETIRILKMLQNIYNPF